MKIREAVYKYLGPVKGKTVAEIARALKIREDQVPPVLRSLERLDLVVQIKPNKGRKHWTPTKWKKGRDAE